MKLYLFLYPLLVWLGGGKPAPENLAYIEQYRLLAMLEQQRTGVPAAITMAQALHESAAGKGDLAMRSNNHFGIKCKATWTGPKVYHDDDAQGECFRAYASVYASYQDHSDFLKQNARYAALFTNELFDYKAWARGLKQAGYATNPRYADILIKTIEDHNLNALTVLATQLSANDSSGLAVYRFDSSSVAVAASTDSTPAQNTDERSVAAAAAAIEAAVAAQQFPEGVFTINGCKVVYLPTETSLLALAQQHGLTLGDLIRYNDLPAQAVLANAQLVFLEKKKTTTTVGAYTLLPGQSLWHAAQALGIKLSVLQAANPRLQPYQAANVATPIQVKGTR